MDRVTDVPGTPQLAPTAPWQAYVWTQSVRVRPPSRRYEATGSGTGQRRIKAQQVDFAGSDALLSEQDYLQYPDLRMFPVRSFTALLLCARLGGDGVRLWHRKLVGVPQRAVSAS